MPKTTKKNIAIPNDASSEHKTLAHYLNLFYDIGFVPYETWLEITATEQSAEQLKPYYDKAVKNYNIVDPNAKFPLAQYLPPTCAITVSAIKTAYDISDAMAKELGPISKQPDSDTDIVNQLRRLVLNWQQDINQIDLDKLARHIQQLRENQADYLEKWVTLYLLLKKGKLIEARKPTSVKVEKHKAEANDANHEAPAAKRQPPVVTTSAEPERMTATSSRSSLPTSHTALDNLKTVVANEQHRRSQDDYTPTANPSVDAQENFDRLKQDIHCAENLTTLKDLLTTYTNWEPLLTSDIKEPISANPLIQLYKNLFNKISFLLGKKPLVKTLIEAREIYQFLSENISEKTPDTLIRIGLNQMQKNAQLSDISIILEFAKPEDIDKIHQQLILSLKPSKLNTSALFATHTPSSLVAGSSSTPSNGKR